MALQFGSRVSGGTPGPKGDKGDTGSTGPPGAIGLPGWNRFKLASDVTNSTVTLVDATSLAFAVAIDTDYEFEFLIPFQTAAQTTGFGLALNGPGIPTLLAVRICVPVSATADVWRHANVYNTEALGNAVDAINVPRLARMTGILRNGSTAGTVIARFRSEVVASAVTVKAGAMVRWQVI